MKTTSVAPKVNMVVSQNRGIPIWTPKCYSPYYGNPQKGTCWCEPAGCEEVDNSGVISSLLSLPSPSMDMAHTVAEAFYAQVNTKNLKVLVMYCYGWLLCYSK